MVVNRCKANPETAKRASLCLLLCVCLLSFPHPTFSQSYLQETQQELFSPTIGLEFHEIAYELTNLSNTSQLSQSAQKIDDIQRPQIEQALTFLSAATNLDSRAEYILDNMLRVATHYPSIGDYTLTQSEQPSDYSGLVYQLLLAYTNESADFLVLRDAVQCLLDKLNSREEREQLLEQLLAETSGKNSRLDSYLATKLGLLLAEKTDTESALKYLMQAFEKNNSNNLAFSKLTELSTEQMNPILYLKQLRLAVSENPLDLTSALDYAHLAEAVQLYQTAADAYQYCAELFAYLYPTEPQPRYIYLPRAICFYNTERNQHKCLQIADDFRQAGRFDLLLEAIAGRAAAKTTGAGVAERILQSAEKEAHRLLMANPSSKTVEPAQLAWFYCFGSVQPEKALDWANKAYSMAPDSGTAASLLAYALLQNGQPELAKTIIENYPPNQIAGLVLAQIQISKQNKEAAIENLKSVIAQDSASLEAELAKQILTQQGGQYISPIDSAVAYKTLTGLLEVSVVPEFISPENIISVEINTRGSKFSYGNKFDGYLVITNNSSEPLVVSENSLFKGNIRIDADVTGDLNKTIPNLVSRRVMPSQPIQSDRNLLIPIRLIAAELRQMLLRHPQASVDIEFTAYIDPVTTLDGKITNGLAEIKPAKTTVERPGVELTGKYLQNRFSSLSKGRQGQRMQTAQLFIGLLSEQNAMANREPLYKFMYADWMPQLLKSAIIHNLNDNDWVVKTHTMAQMLSIPLDYELTDAVAENLYDTHWPTRLTALYLLAKNQGGNFEKVLDWAAEHDENILVRNMAIALGAATPPPPRQAAPQEQEDTTPPTAENTQTQPPD